VLMWLWLFGIFDLRPPGRWTRGFLLKNFLTYTNPEKRTIKA
jgi:hypothetical protein